MFGFIKSYVNKRVNLLRLELTENISLLVSNLIVGIIILTLCFLLLLFVSIGLSIFIGLKLNNLGLGFLIFSLFYLILFIIFLCFYSRISKSIMKKIIEHQINKKRNEPIDEDEQ